MVRHVNLSCNDNIDTDMVVELKPIDASASYILNEIYTLVDHIIDNSSCNSISKQFNNKGNKQTNTIHSVVTTNYIQLISINDTGRTSNLDNRG